MSTKAKTSIDSQIGAVNTARMNASKLHPNRSHTDLLTRQLEDAEATLKFVRKHQDVIRQAVD